MKQWKEIWVVQPFLHLHCPPRMDLHKKTRDFLGGPVAKNPHCNAENMDSIPGQGYKIPHAMDQLSPCTTTTEATSQVERVCAPQWKIRYDTVKILHAATKTQCSQTNIKKKNFQRWWRNRTERPLSPPQIRWKIIWMLSKFHKTTFELWQRTPDAKKGSLLSSKGGRTKHKNQKRQKS